MSRDRSEESVRQVIEREAAAPPMPRAQIAQRVRGTLARDNHATETGRSPSLRWAAAAAAALAIFVGGVEYGRRLAAPVALPVPASPDRDPVGMAIQARGTQYVAELARLSETAATLPEPELEQARQVAAAILYGAAVELVRAAPDDELADLILRALRGRRVGGNDPLIWF